MKPLMNKILLRLDEVSNTTQAGILVAKAWEDARDIGTVEAIGKDVVEVKVGDRVVINPYAVLETRDKDLVFIREDDIMCTFENADKRKRSK